MERFGLVGLPNAGKSSLYNALTGGGALAAPYPFATKDPNIGVAKVPDERVDKLAAMSFLMHHAAEGQIVTGLLYVDNDPDDLHSHLATVDTPLNALGEKELCPGSATLDRFNASLR